MKFPAMIGMKKAPDAESGALVSLFSPERRIHHFQEECIVRLIFDFAFFLRQTEDVAGEVAFLA